jgi:hypothetical protein
MTRIHPAINTAKIQPRSSIRHSIKATQTYMTVVTPHNTAPSISKPKKDIGPHVKGRMCRNCSVW